MSTANVGCLIAQCLDGDDEAQAKFYTEYNELVERAIMRKLASTTGMAPLRADVEDIRNEVFARLLRKESSPLRRLRKPGAINAWLITVAANYTVDHIRRWSRRMEVQACAASEVGTPYNKSPDEEAIAGERTALLDEGLSQLADGDRLILELFFVQGLKYVEIAEMLDMNINTVSTRLRRAKTKLRHLLKEGLDGLP